MRKKKTEQIYTRCWCIYTFFFSWSTSNDGALLALNSELSLSYILPSNRTPNYLLRMYISGSTTCLTIWIVINKIWQRFKLKSEAGGSYSGGVYSKTVRKKIELPPISTIPWGYFSAAFGVRRWRRLQARQRWWLLTYGVHETEFSHLVCLQSSKMCYFQLKVD